MVPYGCGQLSLAIELSRCSCIPPNKDGVHNDRSLPARLHGQLYALRSESINAKGSLTSPNMSLADWILRQPAARVRSVDRPPFSENTLRTQQTGSAYCIAIGHLGLTSIAGVHEHCNIQG